MQVSQLGGFFEIAHYRLYEQSATVRLVGGSITVEARYKFYNVSRQRTGPVIQLEMVVTQQQSDDLKAILADVLQATNAAIEAATGWTLFSGQGDKKEGKDDKHTKGKEDRNSQGAD